MTVRVIIGQLQQLEDEIVAFARQMGVGGVQFNMLPKPAGKGYWDTDEIAALRRTCDEAGLVLEAIENFPFGFYDKVLTGQPGRDEQLEKLCHSIRSVASAGVPTLGYHFLPTSVWRTAMVPGRGGSAVSAFDLEHALAQGPMQYHSPIDRSIKVDADEMWENYRYFCDAVFPVAEEVGLRMALHPDDPPVEKLDNIARLFCNPQSFVKAWEMAKKSPAWGIDLCLGTVSEMRGGAETVNTMLDTFGPLGRIFYVHFRDVQGSVPYFQECFLGEGNYDPVDVMRRLVKYGFDGFVMDDHVPVVVGDDALNFQYRSHAHALGYLQALVAACTRDLEPGSSSGG
jgi:mannonate dehydratase